MSSMAPRRQWPRATRAAAMLPTVAIHCIMRPPWICPGAPACSGNTQFTISVAVSEIESMWSAGRRGSLAFFYHGGHPSAAGGPHMEFEYSKKTKMYMEQLTDFMNKHVVPNEQVFVDQLNSGP